MFSKAVFLHSFENKDFVANGKVDGILRIYLTHYHTMPHFDALKRYRCGKNCEKGEIAYNKQFLLFSQCFLPYMAFIFYF